MHTAKYYFSGRKQIFLGGKEKIPAAESNFPLESQFAAAQKEN